eukprot:TRINITY_DN2125_c0_g1_i5.p1 TRINITY_DN2125_c0_g1~~TRINITY_DN2125_c0_g1_i5.p1  ORF type:complete len:261 (-),score=84.10 TRINITY_DN2125_c0_g1_i5:96-878(-)
MGCFAFRPIEDLKAEVKKECSGTIEDLKREIVKEVKKEFSEACDTLVTKMTELKAIEKEYKEPEDEGVKKYIIPIKNYVDGAKENVKLENFELCENGKFKGDGEDGEDGKEVVKKFKIKGIIKIMGEIIMEKKYLNGERIKFKGKITEDSISGECNPKYWRPCPFKIQFDLKKYLSNKSFLGPIQPMNKSESIYGLAFDEFAFQNRGAWGIFNLGSITPDNQRSGNVHFFNSKQVPVKMTFETDKITLDVEGRESQVYKA